MTIWKMHCMIAGAAIVSLVAMTGCCSSRSCCSRYGQNPDETVATAAVPNATSSVTPRITQKKCPVTDDDLGSMGSPIAVNVNGDTVYVCCQGCVKKVQQNPDAYLAKVVAERNASR